MKMNNLDWDLLVKLEFHSAELEDCEISHSCDGIEVKYFCNQQMEIRRCWFDKYELIFNYFNQFVADDDIKPVPSPPLIEPMYEYQGCNWTMNQWLTCGTGWTEELVIAHCRSNYDIS